MLGAQAASSNPAILYNVQDTVIHASSALSKIQRQASSVQASHLFHVMVCTGTSWSPVNASLKPGKTQVWKKKRSEKSFKMLIKVKTLTGKEIEIDIEPTDKVERIKERVEEKEGIPPPQQRLIFSGKQMNDEKTAADYKVQGGSVLHLVLALRGGYPQC